MSRSARALALPPILLALALLAAPAGALGVHPDAISFDERGIQGGVEVLDLVQGLPDDGFVGYGGVAPGDTTIVMRGRLDPGSDSVLGFASAVVEGASGSERPFSGLGWIAGASGFPITSGQPAPGLSRTAGFFGPFFGGDTTVPYFVSYAEELRAGDTLFVGAGDSGDEFASGSAALVPEPSAATAALLGLALVGWRIRRLG